MKGISIIIPTFKRTKSLFKTIKCLIDQKLDIPFEILIIDQNEKNFIQDNMPEDIGKKIQIIHQSEPNVSSARNLGYLKSKYDILLFIDDDLTANEGFIQKAINLFSQHKFISCLCPLVYSKGQKDIEMQNKINDTLGHRENINIISNAISAAFFIRKQTYYKVGGFDPYLFDYCKSTEDNEFFIRLRKYGEYIYYIPQLEILHDEEILGGCELRNNSWLQNRLKFIKGWTYRSRIHNGMGLELTFFNHIRLIRSTFFNKNLFRFPVKITIALIKFYLIAVFDSRKELEIKNLKIYYINGWKTNHLA